MDLISFTSGIEYFTFQLSFKSFISGLNISLKIVAIVLSLIIANFREQICVNKSFSSKF